MWLGAWQESGASFTLRPVGKLIGVVAIVVGVGFVGVAPNGLDAVFLTLPSGYDIHFYDRVGAAFVALGIVLVWR